MAAAEYYNPGIPQQQGPQGPPLPMNMNMNQNLRPPTQAPPPMQNSSPSPSSLPYPLSDAPPPYSAFADQQRPQSQPPPSQRPPQGYANGGGPVGGYQPYQNGDTHTYPPDKMPPQQRPGLQNTYRPSDYTSQHPIPPPPQQQQIPPPQGQQQNGFVRPGLSSLNYPGKEVRFNTQQRPSSQPAPTGYNNNKPSPDRYNPSPERYRSRSRSRERRSGNGGRRHHSHRPEHNRPDGYYKPSTQEKKKGSSASTFLGAGGGALIGDMIFPGLGTLGGAILGGVGGHEYSKEKKRSVGYGGQRTYSHGDGGGGGRDVYYEDEYRRGRR